MPPVLNDTSRTTCRSLYTSFGFSFLFMPSQPRMQFNRRDSTGEKIELAKSINGQACRINTLLFQNKRLWTIKVGDKTFDVLDISQLSQANQQVKVIKAAIQRRPRQGTPRKWRGYRLWSTKDGRKIEQISKENNSPAEWNWRGKNRVYMIEIWGEIRVYLQLMKLLTAPPSWAPLATLPWLQYPTQCSSHPTRKQIDLVLQAVK